MSPSLSFQHLLDRLLQAARDKDWERFEQLRRDALEEFIRSAPPEQRDRLRAAQWSIERRLDRCGSALERALVARHLMMERLLHLNEALQTVTGNRPQRPTSSAEIIPLQKKTRAP